MPKLIQLFDFESFSLFSRKTKISKLVSQAFYDKYLAPVVELSESFQGGLMASAEREPNGGLGAEPELRGPGPEGPRNSSTAWPLKC